MKTFAAIAQTNESEIEVRVLPRVRTVYLMIGTRDDEMCPEVMLSASGAVFSDCHGGSFRLSPAHWDELHRLILSGEIGALS